MAAAKIRPVKGRNGKEFTPAAKGEARAALARGEKVYKKRDSNMARHKYTVTDLEAQFGDMK